MFIYSLNASRADCPFRALIDNVNINMNINAITTAAARSSHPNILRGIRTAPNPMMANCIPIRTANTIGMEINIPLIIEGSIDLRKAFLISLFL